MTRSARLVWVAIFALLLAPAFTAAPARAASGGDVWITITNPKPGVGCSVTVSVEVRIGDNAGMMNIGIPSIIIKMLRQKFDQQWSRRSQASEDERSRILHLIKPASMHLDTRLQGQSMKVSDLLKIEEGHVLTFDHLLNRPLDLIVNGKLKYRGQVMSTGRKRAFQVAENYVPVESA